MPNFQALNTKPWFLGQVPVTLVHRADLRLDGRAPLLLAAYGAYGECIEADFRPERLSLLGAGWVVALAHVRGGRELGRRCISGAVKKGGPGGCAPILRRGIVSQGDSVFGSHVQSGVELRRILLRSSSGRNDMIGRGMVITLPHGSAGGTRQGGE